MKGKCTFTEREAELIRQTLGRVRRSDRTTQKRLRDELRSMRFYISDFTRSARGFTVADFNALVQRGTITIL